MHFPPPVFRRAWFSTVPERSTALLRRWATTAECSGYGLSEPLDLIRVQPHCDWSTLAVEFVGRRADRRDRGNTLFGGLQATGGAPPYTWSLLAERCLKGFR